MTQEMRQALDPTTVRVTRGHPDPDELAALLVGLALYSGGADDGPTSKSSSRPAPHWTVPATYQSPASWTRPRLRNTVF
ncbi:acyl-CoA carboxylase epsilon subunit [Streptomyces sp. NPDC053048]|uniref:acyl-CoA carboxylase epsilon subunit n=1 Tax=Streptomyces sp. NPDC053048 TaxID=3365694 RepID=UPI0037D2E996